MFFNDEVLFISFSVCCFFFQAEDGIRDLVRSRGLGDVYKRQLNAPHGETGLSMIILKFLMVIANDSIGTKGLFAAAL